MSIKSYFEKKRRMHTRRKATGIKERTRYEAPKYTPEEIRGEYLSVDVTTVSRDINNNKNLINAFFENDILNDEIDYGYLPKLISISYKVTLPSTSYYSDFIKISRYLKNIDIAVAEERKDSMVIRLTGPISSFRNFAIEAPKKLMENKISWVVLKALEILPEFFIKDLIDMGIISKYSSSRITYITEDPDDFSSFENFLILYDFIDTVTIKPTLHRHSFKGIYLTLGFGEEWFALYMLMRGFGITCIMLDDNHKTRGVGMIASASYDQWLALSAWYLFNNISESNPVLGGIEKIFHYIIKSTGYSAEYLLCLYRNPYCKYDPSKNSEISYDPAVDEDIEDTEEDITDNKI